MRIFVLNVIITIAAERGQWDKDVANFNADLKKVEKFLIDVLEKRLTEEQVQTPDFTSLELKGRGTRWDGRCPC